MNGSRFCLWLLFLGSFFSGLRSSGGTGIFGSKAFKRSDVALFFNKNSDRLQRERETNELDFLH